jgi:hypothetical protein
VCCGTEREVTVSCPLDCVHLQEARIHEKLPESQPGQWPNNDIRISEQFLADHQPLLLFLANVVLKAGLETPGAVDEDARAALESLIRTYRTQESGLYYESRPDNLLAGAIYERIRQAVEQYSRQMREQRGMAVVRDADVLGILVFLHRLELQRSNGRRRGRAFLDFLRSYFAEIEGERRRSMPEATRLIVP